MNNSSRLNQLHSMQNFKSYMSINFKDEDHSLLNDNIIIKWRKMKIDDCFNQLNLKQKKKKNTLFDHPFPLLCVLSKRKILNNSDVLIQSLINCNEYTHQRSNEEHLTKSTTFKPKSKPIALRNKILLKDRQAKKNKSRIRYINQTALDIQENKPTNLTKTINKLNESKLFNNTQVLMINIPKIHTRNLHKVKGLYSQDKVLIRQYKYKVE